MEIANVKYILMNEAPPSARATDRLRDYKNIAVMRGRPSAAFFQMPARTLNTEQARVDLRPV